MKKVLSRGSGTALTRAFAPLVLCTLMLLGMHTACRPRSTAVETSTAAPSEPDATLTIPPAIADAVVLANSGRDTLVGVEIAMGPESEVVPEIPPGHVVFAKAKCAPGRTVRVTYREGADAEVSGEFPSPDDGGPLVVVAYGGELIGFSSGPRRCPAGPTGDLLPLGSELTEELVTGFADAALVEEVTVYCLPLDGDRVSRWDELRGQPMVTVRPRGTITRLLSQLQESSFGDGEAPPLPGPVAQRGLALFRMRDGKIGYFQFGLAADGCWLEPPPFADEFGVHDLAGVGMALLRDLTDQACASQ